MRQRCFIALFLASTAIAAAQDILIVADEIPAMETLAKQLETRAHAGSKIAKQTELPASLASFKTVAVYIHKDIAPGTEAALLEYVRKGGRLVLLHHSISSGKRKNQDWLPAFGIDLPSAKFDQGGYAYFDPATFQVVNLAPEAFVTTHGVTYKKQIAYSTDGAGPEKQLQGFTAPDTEIYLNHHFTGPRTKLLGVKWTEPKSGRTYMQDTAGWQMRVGKGTAFYFMVGHNGRDFEIPEYAQILSNAFTGQVER